LSFSRRARCILTFGVILTFIRRNENGGGYACFSRGRISARSFNDGWSRGGLRINWLLKFPMFRGTFPHFIPNIGRRDCEALLHLMPLFWQHTYSVVTISYLYISAALSVPNSQPKTHVSMQHQQTLTTLRSI